ncbi:MAG: hypothetical protein R3B40_15425 [Polyangiales bacterium]|nr:hypothetical protein [Myxococcales bacterium]MCB9658351.1 hypothetical protein [Sandaracinaceae bacterium]
MTDDKCHDRGPTPSPQNARFLDLEPSQMLKGEADHAARRAFRSLLEEAAKERLRERWGERIDGLARLAVDQYLSELDSSLGVEAILERQARATQTHASELADLFRAGVQRESK